MSSLKVALAAQRMRSKLGIVAMEPIAVIGMSCRFPGGANNPDAFWQLLRDGIDAISDIPPSRWDVDAYYDPDPDAVGKISIRQGGFIDLLRDFDADFFNIAPREMKSIDPQQRLLLEVSWEALESAALAPDTLKGSKTGVFVALEKFDYFQRLLERTPEEMDAYMVSGNIHSAAAGRLSYLLDLQGPAVAIDTACSSSLVALHLAIMSLRQGESDLALAGGANQILSPEFTVGISRARMLSPDGRCKTFDASADGMARAEGCGVVVLKRLSDAITAKDNILALIRGSAINQDGRTSGLTVPNGLAQQKVIRQALQNAGLKPAQISYVEAHGTGTSLGDPIEVEALGHVFAEGRPHNQPLLIGSVKTNIGHAEVAAGMAGLIKIILSLQHEEIPPHLHFRQPSPYIDWEHLPLQVTKERTPWPMGKKPRIAGVSGFGLSGTNAHLIIEEAPKLGSAAAGEESHARRLGHILTLSAKNEAALNDLMVRYERHLAHHPEQTLADICFTTNTGRTHFSLRAAIYATSKQQMHQKLAAYNAGEGGVWRGYTLLSQEAPKVAFLFTGQGSQYAGMGRQLYENEPTFRQTLEQCDAYLRLLDVPLLSILYPEEEEARIDQTAYTQPALFALEYALAQLWRSWGIKPDMVIGHSVGEYVAACVAGIFSLTDALKLITARGRLMGALPENGAMVAVMANDRVVEQAIAPVADDISIAAINGPENVVISGRREAVQAIVKQLAADGIKTQELAVSHAFHSSLMEPMLDEFRQVTEGITYRKPKLSLVSNLTGKLADDEVTTAAYWVRHVREAVRFADGVKTLHEQEIDIFLEIGPKATLLGMARLASDEEATVTYLPSLRDNGNDWEQMLTSLGELYVRGMKVNWDGFHKPSQRRKVVLPTYPFQRQRYWIESSDSAQALADSSIIRFLKRGETEQATQCIDLTAFSAAEQAILPKLLAMLATQHQQELISQGSPAAIMETREWLYQIEWQPADSLRASPQPHEVIEAGDTDGNWLIIADKEGIGARVAAELSSKGKRTVFAICASEYHAPHAPDHASQLQIATINPSEPQHTQWLLNELRHLNPLHSVPFGYRTHVIYFAQRQKMSHVEVPQQVLRLSSGLLHLVQALIQADLGPRLWLVTQNAQAVTKKENLSVEQRPLWGLVRTIVAEYPSLSTTCIDLDESDEVGQISSLLQELEGEHSLHPAHTDKENQIAYRDGKRYVARLCRAKIKTPDTTTKIRDDGSYLITGGLGGLGLAVAEQLAAKGAKHLVLAGRRGITSSDTQETIVQLEEAGAKVEVVRADISVESDVTRLLDMSKPLRGIIHAAGISDNALLSEQSPERFREVMAAKVMGTWHLHRRSCTIPLDFFVCFSSMSAILETVGVSGYAAANAFQDGLMQQRRVQGLPGLSINWGIWAEVGMAATAKKQYQKLGLISPKQGAQIAVDLALASQKENVGQLAVTSVNWTELYGTLFQDQKTALLNELTQQKTEVGSAPSILRTELEQATPRERYQRLISYIQEEVAKVLGLSQPPAPQQGFFDMGMDSLMVVEFRNRLHSLLDLTLPSTLLFQYSTIEELTEYLAALLTTDEDSTDEQPGKIYDPSQESISLSKNEIERLVAEKYRVLNSLLGKG
jgi:acyl transferase domain-containing protein/acyl carrier protein